jgi:hypothetical protein
VIHPLSSALQAILAPFVVLGFEAAGVVELRLNGRCPETVADDLRLWLRQNCTGQQRQVERSAGVVKFEFEHLEDAVLFQLTHQ